MMRAAVIAAVGACAAAAMAFSAAARGDSPCNKGYRDTTPAERATITAVLQAAKKALPPAPTGWVIDGDDQISVTTRLCRDYEGAPWDYHFGRSYTRVDDQAARDKIMADAAAASVAAQAKKQPRLDALMARMEKLTKTQVALIQKGDMAGATALDGEMVALQAQYQAVADEGDSQAQLEAAAAKAGRDQHMYIGVQVNSNQVKPDNDAKAVPPPAGARAAYRWSTDREGVIDDHVLMLLGQWRSSADGVWKRALHPEMAPTAAQVITIEVTADPGRIAGILGSIDVRTLATKVPN
jgi:hypothetical protein